VNRSAVSGEGATWNVFGRHLNDVKTSQGHAPLEAPDPVNDPPMISLYASNETAYLVFAAAFFLRSAQRFFIKSESLLRPAALNLLVGFALTALLLGLLLVCCGAGLLKLDPLRMLRAEVSLAISPSISCTILAVST
jgi:hypothetical protein